MDLDVLPARYASRALRARRRARPCGALSRWAELDCSADLAAGGLQGTSTVNAALNAQTLEVLLSLSALVYFLLDSSSGY